MPITPETSLNKSTERITTWVNIDHDISYVLDVHMLKS